jgi:hypothetical protein
MREKPVSWKIVIEIPVTTSLRPRYYLGRTPPADLAAYNSSPTAAITPIATPPTVEPLPTDAAAPGETLGDAAEAVSAAPVAVAVGELETVELTTPAGTSLASRVPQVRHFWEPGLSRRHCSKVATQMELGTEPMYAPMLAGAVPFLQVQVYLGISI